MSTLTFRRPGGDSAGVFRDLRVFVDGMYVVGLKPGHSRSVEVAAGRHEVVGNMDWAKSPVLVCEVPEGEHVVVEVSLSFVGALESFLPGRTPVKVQLVDG